MADHVWNLNEVRVFSIGIAGDWRAQMSKFLLDSSFRVVAHRRNRSILKAEQRGLHINFKARSLTRLRRLCFPIS